MSSYGQFCPVAKAMEILDERWTMLVLRELMAGSSHFNEIRRGVPRMSPALLSKRLRSLVRYGLVERRGSGQQIEYTLTRSGRELTDVVQAIGLWGLRWIPELGDEDYDPHLLLWDIHRTMPVELWPPGRTVLELTFRDVDPKVRSWWLVVRDQDVEVCDTDPGYEVAAAIRTDLRTLTRIWRGEHSWAGAMRSGAVTLTGSSALRREVPRLIGQSDLAALDAARRLPTGPD